MYETCYFSVRLSPEQVSVLLKRLDEHLYNHFQSQGMGDILFVHRWDQAHL